MSTSDDLIFPGAKVMQLVEWGYPQLALRAVPPEGKTISVIHITGNARLPSAEGEATWRLTDKALQNSATFFVNRDGSVVQCLSDPLHMAPWANGDVNQPDMSNRRIAQIVADEVNANMRTLVAIENVGCEPDAPLTDAQVKTDAKIIAHYHKLAGVAINRTSVVGHYQLNSVTRPNCPARKKDVIDRIVEAAMSLTVAGEDPQVIEYYKDLADRRWDRIQRLIADKEALQADVAKLEAELAELESLADANSQLRQRISRLRGRLASVKSLVADMAAQVDAA